MYMSRVKFASAVTAISLFHAGAHMIKREWVCVNNFIIARGFYCNVSIDMPKSKMRAFVITDNTVLKTTLTAKESVISDDMIEPHQFLMVASRDCRDPPRR